MEDEGSGAAREAPETDEPDEPTIPSWLREGVRETIDDASPRATGVSPPPFVARSPLFDPTTQSTSPEVCPFFRAVDDSGSFWPPIETPDVANRCIAIGLPKPQSARQQDLVCLSAGHVNCPRYLRGALGVKAPVSSTGVRRSPSTPVALSALALVLAAAVSVGFLLVRGGLSLPIASFDPNVVAVSSIEPSPSPTPTIAASTPSPSPSPSTTPSPIRPSASPSPAPTPVPTLTPRPTPRSTPKPAPTSNRYALLDPCPNAPGCWIYTVRAGDNLVSIVNWFGVSYDRVLRMNPQIDDPTTIRKGDRIKLPPPTR